MFLITNLIMLWLVWSAISFLYAWYDNFGLGTARYQRWHKKLVEKTKREDELGW